MVFHVLNRCNHRCIIIIIILIVIIIVITIVIIIVIIIFIIFMLRRFFTSFDLFGAMPTLRMRGESETINLCAGVASLFILLVFLYLFATKAFSIMALEEIEAKITISVEFFLSSNVNQTKLLRHLFSLLLAFALLTSKGLGRFFLLVPFSSRLGSKHT